MTAIPLACDRHYRVLSGSDGPYGRSVRRVEGFHPQTGWSLQVKPGLPQIVQVETAGEVPVTVIGEAYQWSEMRPGRSSWSWRRCRRARMLTRSISSARSAAPTVDGKADDPSWIIRYITQSHIFAHPQGSSI